jgi:hypothetical protein
MDYAPDNEQGVVFLFSSLARKRFGLRIESIGAGFPDCIAYQGRQRIKIEFEFRSRNFLQHRHPVRGCNWIVCWEHNWPGVPKHLQVKELRREFGLGFNVWFQPVGIYDNENYADELAAESDVEWSVPSLAMVGDLLLYYRTAKSSEPKSCVQDIFRVTSPVEHKKAGWKRGLDYMANIKRVCTLKAPLHLTDLRQNKVLCDAGFVRGQMQGRPRATEYWPELHHMIISRNPSVKRELRKYGPERLT